MLLRGDVAADDEGVADLRRQLFDLLTGAGLGHLLPDLIGLRGAEVQPFERLLKERARVEQLDILVAVLEMAHVPQCEDRLAAVALAAAHRRNRAGRRDRRLRGIADPAAADAVADPVPVELGAAPIAAVGRERLRMLPAHPTLQCVIVDAAFERQERRARIRQLDTLLHAVIAHELHHLRRELLPRFAAVADAQFVHQVAQAHDAQPDAPRLERRLLHHGDRRQIGVGADHVVEEMRALAHRTPQRVPVDRGRAGGIGRYVRAQVDRAEAAVLIRPQPLFAARVGRLQLVQVRDGVAAVGRVNEERARFAVVVGVLDDGGEQFARPHRPGDRAVARVAQVVVAVILDRLHELVGERDRNIEICDRALFGLTADELLNIGVIDP